MNHNRLTKNAYATALGRMPSCVAKPLRQNREMEANTKISQETDSSAAKISRGGFCSRKNEQIAHIILDNERFLKKQR
jgi:hypothetical protein